MNKFKEGTNLLADVNFRSDGVATVPGSVHWKLRNVTANKTVVDWTSVFSASSVQISIAAQYLAIEDDDNDKEKQELIILANKDLPGQVPEVIQWWVQNIGGL